MAKDVKYILGEHLADVKDIIWKKIEDNTFDSHKFIQSFSEEYELVYIQMLLTQIDLKEKIFRAVHSQIANFLKENQIPLGITQLPDKVESLNIFGNKTSNTNWKK